MFLNTNYVRFLLTPPPLNIPRQLQPSSNMFSYREKLKNQFLPLSGNDSYLLDIK